MKKLWGVQKIKKYEFFKKLLTQKLNKIKKIIYLKYNQVLK